MEKKNITRFLLIFVAISLLLMFISLSKSADPFEEDAADALGGGTGDVGTTAGDAGTDTTANTGVESTDTTTDTNVESTHTTASTGLSGLMDRLNPFSSGTRTDVTTNTNPEISNPDETAEESPEEGLAGGGEGLAGNGEPTTGDTNTGTELNDDMNDFTMPHGNSIPTGETSGTETGGEDTQPVKPSTKQPEQMCIESDDFKIPKFDGEKFNGNLSLEEEIDEKVFRDQMCSFFNNEKKDEVWEGLNEAQKGKLLEGIGKQYGINNIDVKGLKGAKWGKDNLLEVGGSRINLDFENYYSDEKKSKDFSFRGESKYKYGRKNIREIKVADDGSVSMSFGDGDKDLSTINLKGGAEFDPAEMKIKSGDKTYEWNGQGKVDFNSAEGKLKMDFAPGSSDTDVTNFPIMKMPGGEEISPFQEVVSGKKLDGVTKPSSGYRVDPTGKYTIDSNGVVREIKNSEVTIDKSTGKVTEIKDAYINNKEFNGDVFASGSYGIGKSDKGSYFSLDGGVLTIVSGSGNTLYYKQGSKLTKLDVKGAGKTYIRNGDYLLKFEGDKFNIRILPKPFQEEGGKAKFTIDEIFTQKNPKKPYKLIEGKDKKIGLHDSEGKPIDWSKFKDGQVAQPTKPGTGTGGTFGGSSDTPSISSYAESGLIGKVSESEFNIGDADWKKITAETGLTKEQIIDKLVDESSIEFKIKVVNKLAASIGGKKGITDTFRKEAIRVGVSGEEFDNNIKPLLDKNLGTVSAGTYFGFTTDGKGGLSMVTNGGSVSASTEQQATIKKIIKGSLRNRPDNSMATIKDSRTNAEITTPPINKIYDAYQKQSQK